MIEVFKTTNPKVLPYITEKFSEIQGLDIDAAIEFLLLKLASDPDNTMFVVGFEDQELKSFIFGWVNSNEKHGWIQQAWTDVDFPKEYKIETLNKFEDWVEEKGFSVIKCQTKRQKMNAWKKLYNFEEDAVVLTKEI